MRIIVAILCFMALINGANASYSSSAPDIEQPQYFGTHLEKVHLHSDHADINKHNDGKCHVGCSMLSAIMLRRDDSVVSVEGNKTQLSIFSYLHALYQLFDFPSSDKELAWNTDGAVSSLPVYISTQRLRI